MPGVHPSGSTYASLFCTLTTSELFYREVSRSVQAETLTSGDVDCQQQLAERNNLRRTTLDLIALVERGGGYADVPPGSITDELEVELAVHGYATGLSDRLWLVGYRVYSRSPSQQEIIGHRLGALSSLAPNRAMRIFLMRVISISKPSWQKEESSQ